MMNRNGGYTASIRVFLEVTRADRGGSAQHTVRFGIEITPTERLIRRRRIPVDGQREPDPRASRMRKVPPPAGRATGHTPGAEDGWLWNSNDTPRPDR